jgi:hypothetical protein
LTEAFNVFWTTVTAKAMPDDASQTTMVNVIASRTGFDKNLLITILLIQILVTGSYLKF